jgi:hypothetical protein
MEKLITFITIIAWVLGLGSTALLSLRLYGAVTYTQFERDMDTLRGVRTVFPMLKPFIVALLCWSWILTF